MGSSNQSQGTENSSNSSWSTHRTSAFEAIALQLDQFLKVGRALEARLAQSEEKNHRLERELKEAHALYDRLLRDERTKNTEAAISAHRLHGKLKAHQEAEQMVKMQFSSLSAELQSRTAELKQFQERWSTVLQREAEAKTILSESDANRRAREETEKRLQAAEATIAEERELRRKAREQTAAYRRELEHAVRSVDAITEARTREWAAKSQAKVPMPQAAAQAPKVSDAVKIQAGMSWMSPRASHDDNPAEMFEAELASWRDSSLAPSP